MCFHRLSGRRLEARNTLYQPPPKPKRVYEPSAVVRLAFVDFAGFEEFKAGKRLVEKIKTQLEPHDSLEVDNCEISGFAHSGIFLRKGAGHQVHHNFIHHCQYNGLGYGISHDRASSLIEYNHFDWNRHSIAGTGRTGCSYVARHNVELGTSLSHCFDMHGGSDRDDGTDIAGTSIMIYNNTFRAKESAVVIRGIPEEKCEVYQNWFPVHKRKQRAVRASQKTTARDNLYSDDEIK